MDIIVLSSNEEIRNLIVETLSDTRRLTGITGITAGNMSISADPKKHSAAVIVSPLADVFGLDTAVQFCKGGGAGVVFVTTSENAEKASDKVSKYPIMILPRPVNRFIISEALRLILHNAERNEENEKEKAFLEKKLNDIKLMNRAKAAMIKYLAISEEEAHSQLQKRAMNQQRPISEVAAEIIKTYEYLD